MTRKVRTLAFRGMMQDRYERYRSLLRRAASKLSGKTDAPISTRHICAVLGVTVRRSRDQAKTTLARTASDEFEIVLPVRRQDTPYLDRFPRFSSDTESRERWWIAHEIGHVVLLQSRIPAPLGSEYWPFEDLCDDFAGLLLAPDPVVQDVAQAVLPKSAPGGICDSTAWLRAVETLASRAAIPWGLAACRMHGWRSDVWFLVVRLAGSERLKVVFSALARKREFGTLIESDDPLGKAVASAPREEIVAIARSQLAPLKSAAHARSAAIHRISRSAARIAICGDPDFPSTVSAAIVETSGSTAPENATV